MQKWEYLANEIIAETIEEVAKDCNVLGESHWELVSVDNGIAYFKRPIGGVRNHIGPPRSEEKGGYMRLGK